MKELWLSRLLLSDHTIRILAKRLGDRSDSKNQLQGLDPYNWHRLSWDAFPERDGVARDFLTRLDEQAGRARLLILSPMAPAAPKWLNDGDDWGRIYAASRPCSRAKSGRLQRLVCRSF